MITSAQLERVKEMSQVVYDDLHAEAEVIDQTPFTAHGVGTALGTLMAEMAALAAMVKCLAEAALDQQEQDTTTGRGEGR